MIFNRELILKELNDIKNKIETIIDDIRDIPDTKIPNAADWLSAASISIIQASLNYISDVISEIKNKTKGSNEV